MKPARKQNGNKLQATYQEILKVKEEIGMSASNHINNLTAWLSKGITSKTPARVLGGLALGSREGGWQVYTRPWSRAYLVASARVVAPIFS